MHDSARSSPYKCGLRKRPYSRDVDHAGLSTPRSIRYMYSLDVGGED